MATVTIEADELHDLPPRGSELMEDLFRMTRARYESLEGYTIQAYKTSDNGPIHKISVGLPNGNLVFVAMYIYDAPINEFFICVSNRYRRGLPLRYQDPNGNFEEMLNNLRINVLNRYHSGSLEITCTPASEHSDLNGFVKSILRGVFSI